MQLELMWLNLCSMQISKTQLAFLYAVLANVGVASPCSHPRYQLDSIRPAEMQAKHARTALAILNADSQEPDDAHRFSRCQVLTLLCWYYRSAARYDVAVDYCHEAIQAAHACHLFDLTRWQDATPDERHTVRILQMELPFIYKWLTYSQDGRSSFQPNFPEPAVIVVQPEDPVEQARLHHKVHGSVLAYRAALQCQHRKTMPMEVAIQTAMQLDDEILAYTKSNFLVRDVPDAACIDPSNRQSAQLADSVVLSRGGLMLMRYRMMIAFAEQYPLDHFRHTALSSARMVFQMLPLV